MGRRYVCDIETPPIGRIDRIHCAVLIDIDSREVFDYRIHGHPEQTREFIQRYKEADLIVGHNFIGFDHEEIRKILGITKSKHQVIDTIPLGRLVWSDLKKTGPGGKGDWERFQSYKNWKTEKEDAEKKGIPFNKISPPYFPGNLVGSDSLETWGYRFGKSQKGDYSKAMADKAKAQGITGKEEILDYTWGKWNPDMHEYMIQDGLVNLDVYLGMMEELESRVNPNSGAPIDYNQSVTLTMRLQWICSSMERNGWPFDRKKANKLYQELSDVREKIRQELAEDFPTYEEPYEFIPGRSNQNKGWVKGVPVTRYKTIEFNAGSRDQISKRLMDKYGWKPVEFNEDKKDEYGNTVTKGKPKIDDDILKELYKTRGWEECKKLSQFFMIQKRIGQVAEGNQGWLKLVSPEGRIHGRYKVNGTVGGRASHSKPNVGQVPAVGIEYGAECRELFYVPKEWGTQVGADQSGLELRCLGSFLCGFDNGAYIEEVLHGDIHWENAKAIFGLPEDLQRDDSNPAHKAARGYAKTIIYALIYGAGDAKLGSIIGKGVKAGRQIRQRMMGKFPALKKLIDKVAEAAKRGWIIGLDGRILPVRSPHAALNTLLQSAGYVICAQWLIECEDAFEARGWKEGWDGDYVWLGWIHDEAQWAVRDQYVEEFKKIVVEAARRAGHPFPQWRCPTDGEAKHGNSWKDCH